MDASPLLWIVPISGLVAVLVAAYFAYDVLSSPTGTPAMQEVAGAIYEAAVAFIKRQYRTIFLLALGGMVVIGIVIYLFESAPGVSGTGTFPTSPRPESCATTLSMSQMAA